MKTPYIKVQNRVIHPQVGKSFAEAVNAAASSADFTIYYVYMNDVEIHPHKAPEEITPTDQIEIRGW